MRRQTIMAASVCIIGLSADTALACSDHGPVRMTMSMMPGGGIVGGGVVFVLPLLLGTVRSWFAHAAGLTEHTWPRAVLASYLSTLVLTIGGIISFAIPPMIVIWFPMAIWISSSIEHQFLSRFVAPVNVAPVEVDSGWTDARNTLSYARPIPKPKSGLKYWWIFMGNLVTAIALPMLVPLMGMLNLLSPRHHRWAIDYIVPATITAGVIGVVALIWSLFASRQRKVIEPALAVESGESTDLNSTPVIGIHA
ncbi:MAG TPA: hypothetical protein PK402_03085 [Tepidisphaeraceae bacterium]|nr:hypothetical protein [Tepidisphaeraceae bacterium]